VVNQLSDRNRVLRDALAVAPFDPSRAIELLSTALDKARSVGAIADVAALAKHAGAVSQASGDLAAAAAFYSEAAVANPSDAHLQLALGGVLRDLGKIDQARQALLACLAGAAKTADEDLTLKASAVLSALESED